MTDEREARRVEHLLDEVATASRRQAWDEVVALAGDIGVLDPGNPAAEHWSAIAEQRLHAPRLGDGAVAGERRQMTVLFADMVGSTQTAGTMDPELYRELLLLFQRACSDAISGEGGYVANWLGDGLVSYFGYPSTDEASAVSAVIAGLRMCEAVEAIAPDTLQRYGTAVAVRVGVHSGLVVLAGMGVDERVQPFDVVGDTPNLAARVQAEAAPNTVVMTSSTYDLVRGFITVEPLGARVLRGRAVPIELFHALRHTGARSRYEAQRGAQTFHGRSDELSRMGALLLTPPDERPRAVIVTGEPGIGKSRLVDELAALAAAAGYQALRCSCSPRFSRSPLRPLVRLLEEWSGVEAWDDEPVRSQKLERALAPFDIPGGLRALFASTAPEGQSDGTPEQMLEQTMDGLTAWLHVLGARQPSLLVVEDLHWVDPSTQELLSRLVGGRPPMAIVATSRRSGDPWLTRLGADEVRLGPLADTDCGALVRSMPMCGDLPPQVVELLVSRSDGVPLFAEELARMVGEQPFGEDGRPLGERDIPPSLSDVLTVRLDRIPEAKHLAQIAATVGRECPQALLTALAGLDPARFRAQADTLVASGVWEPSGHGEYATYRFRHRLLQDATYQSQLLSRRRQVHKQVADLMRDSFPELVQDEPAVLAHHLERGGEPLGAVQQWGVAGEAAAGAGGHAEAVSLFGHALDLLSTSFPDGTLDPLELGLQLKLGASLSTSQGYGSEEVNRAFARARALCDHLGSPPELFPAIWGSWTFYLVRGQYSIAFELAQRCLEIAAGSSEHALAIEAHTSMGITEFYMGRFGDALASFDEAIALYDDRPEVSPFQRFQHPGVVARAVSAAALWALGRPTEAVARSGSALDLAATIDSQLRWFAIPYGESFAAWLYTELGDMEQALQHAQVTIDRCNEFGVPMFLAAGEMHKGFAQAALGARDEGIARLTAALEAFQLAGAQLQLPYFLARLGELHLSAGRADVAVGMVERAVKLARDTGEGFYEADLARRSADLLADLDPLAAVSLADEAMALAVRSGSPTFQLRAALARHRARPDRQALADLARLCADAEDDNLPEVAAARRIVDAGT